MMGFLIYNKSIYALQGEIMKRPTILRKRFIPSETVDISGDEILFSDEELLITRWKSIKPRKDFSNGVSYTFLKEGFKISRFYNAEGNFIYWYCDIADIEHDVGKDTYILTDLLVDIKVMPDGTVNVLDVDELAEAIDRNILSCEQVSRTLKRLHELLNMIYRGKFPPEICKREEYWIK